MAEFLVSRSDGAPPSDTPVDEVGVLMFFQMWAARQDPFNTLEDGDTLWWVDRRTRVVCWELRVANLRRARYESISQALERLRRWFGVLPGDLTEYHRAAPAEGWLLAWENDLISSVGCPLPAGERLGRNGFRRLDERTARSFGLPRPGRSALIPTTSIEADLEVLAIEERRSIPRHVRRSVFERDGRVCRLCGSDQGPFHLDHIHPWSKGGSNRPDNLQVLCAACNMAKGASVGQPGGTVPALSSIVGLAHDLGIRPPSTHDELTHMLITAIDSGQTADVVTAMWDIFHHADLDEGMTNAVLAATDLLPDEWIDHDTIFDALTEGPVLDAELTPLLEAALPVSTRAAAFLSWSSAFTTEQRIDLAELALPSPDPRVEALARLLRAELNDSEGYDWTEDILFAVNSGDARTSTRAALRIGSAPLDDQVLQYSMLELALRSPSLLVASEAARAIADLFADDPDVARIYARRHEELAHLLERTLR